MSAGLMLAMFYLLIAVLIFSYATMLNIERGISSLKATVENLIGALLWPFLLVMLMVQMAKKGW